MLNLVPNLHIPISLEEREIIDNLDIQRVEAWQKNFVQSVSQLTCIPCIRNFSFEMMFPISQKFSEYSSLPYGKIGNVAEAGCGPLAVEYALRLLGHSYGFNEVLDECVTKGYRAYVFDKHGVIIDGAGSEHSLFYNNAITLQGVHDFFKYLRSGCPITLLVNNTIYHDDENRRGNHFVTLIGIDENGNLLIMDGNLISDEMLPSAAFVKKNFRKMASGIRCAWAWKV